MSKKKRNHNEDELGLYLGVPINEPNDILEFLQSLSETYDIQLEKDVEIDIMLKYITNPKGKDHIVFSTLDVEEGTEFYIQFVSNEQIEYKMELDDIDLN